MITGYELIEKMYSDNYSEYEDTRLYSTGDDELDDLLERAFCEGYEYAQKEFASYIDKNGNLVGENGMVMTKKQMEGAVDLFGNRILKSYKEGKPGGRPGMSYDDRVGKLVERTRKYYDAPKKAVSSRNKQSLLIAKKPLSRLPKSTSSTSSTMPGVSFNYNYTK